MTTDTSGITLVEGGEALPSWNPLFLLESSPLVAALLLTKSPRRSGWLMLVLITDAVTLTTGVPLEASELLFPVAKSLVLPLPLLVGPLLPLLPRVRAIMASTRLRLSWRSSSSRRSRSSFSLRARSASSRAFFSCSSFSALWRTSSSLRSRSSSSWRSLSSMAL